ncbi:MAG: tRNA guanosine(15) transglycosylase TgtA [Thaumarchaeota archaeon]|nr:tRNA guanosine(15) transglycosylase TgtA [Nitrososphaerota archaeon]
MSRGVFEVLGTDLGGRVGRLHTEHGTVETPAYVPVVHPVRQAIDPSRLRGMGFEMVITNAYITLRNHGDEAARRGIHATIGYDGAVMTDSGGYQVLEYGAVDVLPADMAAYERAIRSDIAVPLDRPTGLGLSRRAAARNVAETLESARAALASSGGAQVWAGTIQGSEHLALVRRCARELAAMGYRFMALGSPVELMEQYEYARLAAMIVAARSAIPPGLPLHLFGSGHPLTIPFSVALGCDTFDSASYALYAKHGRYITPDGTRRLDSMSHFACACEVCSARTPAELRAEPAESVRSLLSLHNLHAIKSEVDAVRESIHEGRLWEHAMQKMRAHPRLHEVAAALASGSAGIAHGTPRFKARAAFLYGAEDAARPEIRAYHAMVSRFRTRKARLCMVGEPEARPAYLDPAIARLEESLGDDTQVCVYSEWLGAMPLELCDVYPAAHHVAPRDRGPLVTAQAAEALAALVAGNSFTSVVYDADDARVAAAVRTLPRGIRRYRLKRKKGAGRVA